MWSELPEAGLGPLLRLSLEAGWGRTPAVPVRPRIFHLGVRQGPAAAAAPAWSASPCSDGISTVGRGFVEEWRGRRLAEQLQERP